MIEEKLKGDITVRVIADSISDRGIRLTTYELEYQRFFHSEFMTHKMLSKNAASTRAIPVERAIQLMLERPAMPIHWGLNNPGMQSNAEMDETRREAAEATWLASMNDAAAFARVLSDKDGINGHKQWVGRIIEPYSFMKVVCTGTEFSNLFALRHHKDAQPEFFELSKGMIIARSKSTPQLLKPGQWHLPYVNFVNGKYFVGGVEVPLDVARKVSASCCAQASYRRLDDTVEKALDIFDKLKLEGDSTEPKHASPVEHQGTPIDESNIPFNPNTWENGITHVRRDGSLWSGNLRGWVQYRQLIPNEAVWD